MHELVINLHMHTRFSDGTGTHEDIAKAAIKAGLDAVIVTDHNVWVSGVEGYFKEDRKRVLLLVGEEIHDQDREPQKSHLLVFGAGRELSIYADKPQELIDQVRKANGLAFIAHPIDPEQRALGQDDLSWEDWDTTGYAGIELWNGFSEFKVVTPTMLHALLFAFFPQLIARGPIPGTLRLWDELLSNGGKVVAIGGSDAHALHESMGPLRRVIFPYEFHFNTINTHIFSTQQLTGDPSTDRRLILEALGRGRAFIGYDLPASTSGFRFSAQGREKTAIMGEDIPAEGGVTLQIRVPHSGDIHLIKDGQLVHSWKNRDYATFITTDPGVYRVEVYKHYLGKKRGWIFSNPIYVI